MADMPGQYHLSIYQLTSNPQLFTYDLTTFICSRTISTGYSSQIISTGNHMIIITVYNTMDEFFFSLILCTDIGSKLGFLTSKINNLLLSTYQQIQNLHEETNVFFFGSISVQIYQYLSQLCLTFTTFFLILSSSYHIQAKDEYYFRSIHVDR